MLHWISRKFSIRYRTFICAGNESKINRLTSSFLRYRSYKNYIFTLQITWFTTQSNGESLTKFDKTLNCCLLFQKTTIMVHSFFWNFTYVKVYLKYFKMTKIFLKNGVDRLLFIKNDKYGQFQLWERTSHSFNENQPMHRKRNFLKIFCNQIWRKSHNVFI